MLCAVVVPVLTFALGWTFYELAVVSQVRIAAAEDLVALSANRLEQLFGSLRVATQAFSAAGGRLEPVNLCNQFQPVLRDVAGAEAGLAFYDGQHLSCATAQVVAGSLRHEMLTQIAERLRARQGQVVVSTGGASFFALAFPRAEGGPNTFFIFVLPQHELLQHLSLALLRNAEAASFLTRGGQVLSTWLISTKATNAEAATDVSGWLPENALPQEAATASRSFKSKARNGIRSLFVTAPIGTDGDRLLVSYRASPVFTAERQQFYQVALSFLAVLAAMIAGIVWALDRSLMRWIIYLRRIAIAHAKGRWSVRATRLEDAPSEFRELGEAVNHMAEHISGHAQMLETALAEKAAILQELHHRVKNNFQVIASLLNLHKKGLPQERWNETRFLEEHVSAMAIAYRASYAAGHPKGVPPIQMICDVVEALRETAGIRTDCVRMICVRDEGDINLDKAISLSLYIAYFLPPYLTRDVNSKHPLTIDISLDGPLLRLELTNLPRRAAMQPALRDRLAEAYARQIGVFVRVSADDTELSIEIPLHQPEEIRAA